jgi:hypothetical protein
VGELATSMLLAAPAAAMLALPAALMLGTDVPAQPERVAFLFLMGLMGAWGSLVPAKLFEGRRPDPAIRRAVSTGAWAAVGLAGAALAAWLELGPLPRWDTPVDESLFGRSSPLSAAGYFGLIGLLGGWPWLAARDRKARFRLLPVFKAGLVGLALGLVWPFPQPWGLGVAALAAIVTQAVSPWSEPAAAYARYAAWAAARGRKAA